MATSSKIIGIGNSVGIILPKELMSRLNMEKGDTLYLRESPDGITLTPFDDEFASKMQASDRVIRRYRDALKKLAE